MFSTLRQAIAHLKVLRQKTCFQRTLCFQASISEEQIHIIYNIICNILSKPARLGHGIPRPTRLLDRFLYCSIELLYIYTAKRRASSVIADNTQRDSDYTYIHTLSKRCSNTESGRVRSRVTIAADPIIDKNSI